MSEPRDPREVTRRAIPVLAVSHEEATDIARKVLAGEVPGCPGMMKAASILARYVVDIDEDLRATEPQKLHDQVKEGKGQQGGDR